MTKTIAPILQRVCLTDVKCDERLRPVTDAGVQSILASVEEIGRIKDPVHLRKTKAGLKLLAGGHRMAAYEAMGVSHADAWVWSGITNDHARLIEIDDNLAGAEMGPLDTAVFLAERKRVFQRMHPEAVHGGDRKSVTFKNQVDTMSIRFFVDSTAAKFGLSERHVRRLVEAGEKLDPANIAALRAGRQRVTLKDLIELAKIGEREERNDVIDALFEGKAKSAAEARRAYRARIGAGAVVPAAKKDADFMALVTAWKRAGAEARKRFLLEMRHEVWEAQNKGASLLSVVRTPEAPDAA